MQQCKSTEVTTPHNASDHAQSDVDDDDTDNTDSRPTAAGPGTAAGGSAGGDGREEPDTKLAEDGPGRDLLSQLHHHHQPADRDRDMACDSAAIIRRSRKRPADHVTSSPSLDEDDDDYIDFGLSAGNSPSRHHATSDDAASSPSITPRPGAAMEQTEIKIQRPLGLLAQHGITTKTPAAALQARTAHSGTAAIYKMDRPGPGDLEPSSKDRPPHHPTLAGLDFSNTPLSLMDRRFMPSPPAPSTPLSCLDPAKPATTSPGAHHWTFEEQFKQVDILTHYITHVSGVARGGFGGSNPLH